MGILSLPFSKGQPYVDAGLALTLRLCRDFNLPDWHNGLPRYTQDELDTIRHHLNYFQDDLFHPDALEIQRNIVAEALIYYAWHLAMEISVSDDPPDWRLAVSAYLKAWASKQYPMALIYLSELLENVDQPEAAKEAHKVVLLLRGHAKGHEDLARQKEKLSEETLAGVGGLAVG